MLTPNHKHLRRSYISFLMAVSAQWMIPFLKCSPHGRTKPKSWEMAKSAKISMTVGVIHSPKLKCSVHEKLSTVCVIKASKLRMHCNFKANSTNIEWYRRICGEDYQIKRELCNVIKQKELSDFIWNQIALYSWIILKCCHFVVTGQFPGAKVQHFQGFSAPHVHFFLIPTPPLRGACW